MVLLLSCWCCLEWRWHHRLQRVCHWCDHPVSTGKHWRCSSNGFPGTILTVMSSFCNLSVYSTILYTNSLNVILWRTSFMCESSLNPGRRVINICIWNVPRWSCWLYCIIYFLLIFHGECFSDWIFISLLSLISSTVGIEQCEADRCDKRSEYICTSNVCLRY